MPMPRGNLNWRFNWIPNILKPIPEWHWLKFIRVILMPLGITSNRLGNMPRLMKKNYSFMSAAFSTIPEQDEKKWLALAKDEFDEAVKLDPRYSPAYYFMGLAYKEAFEFNLAGQMFTKVLELKTGYVDEADVQWKFLQKVQRAMPGTATGKQIALVERLTRADAAALFMEELKIDVLYKKRTPKTFDDFNLKIRKRLQKNSTEKTA